MSRTSVGRLPALAALLFGAVATVLLTASGATGSGSAVPADDPAWNADALHTVAGFEPNAGQFDPEIDHVLRAGEATVYLSGEEVRFALPAEPAAAASPVTDRTIPEGMLSEIGVPDGTDGGAVVAMRFRGAGDDVQPIAAQVAGPPINYFLGDDPTRWVTGRRPAGVVGYDDLIGDTDVRFVSTADGFRYDLHVEPGTDPGDLLIDFSGAAGLQVDAAGDLLVAAPDAATLTFSAPVAYQHVDGERREIAVSFAVQDADTVSFAVGDYDGQRPLVIDPTLDLGTYLGGSGDDHGRDVAVGADGALYVLGDTSSTDYPTTVGAHDQTDNGGGDIVVSKLSADGSTVLWSTYLGGGGGDAAGDLALDGNGDLVVAGSTTSTDFPVTAGAHDGTANGGTDGVVFELDDTGATLHGSTYLGGSSFDRATRVTVDPGGSVVVAGETSSGDFPAGVGAFDPDKSNVGGPTDGFVAKLPADLTALGWATFVGDSGDEWMGDIDTDSTGAVWLSLTSTGALPAVNAYDSTANGGGDVWLARLSADGTTLDYATWLGGTGSETGPSAIEVHGDDRIYVGSVATTGFPTTAGSYDPTADASEAGLVVLDPTAVGAAQLVYGTALGGASGSWISDVITDPGGRAYLVGDITQAGLATDGAPDPTVGGAWDGLVAVLDPAHATLDLLTYAGGVGDDSLHGVALTADGSVVVAGSSTSTDLPTTAGAYDRTFGGVADGFVHMYSAVPTADSVVVNHTADGGDVNAGDGICQTATAGQCTLRAAIEEADANALIDTVRFAIPAGLASGGSWTIPLGTTLSINTAVTVDATTQPGYAGSPKVLLLGTGASNGSDAFTINGDGVVVRGFAIADFPAAGIHVAPGADATTIESNHIGTDVTGTVADGQQDDGIFADQATNLVIGGPGVGNLISGNGSAGISLANVTGAVVQGNRIGTRADGQAALANDHNGVFADGGTSLIIGGTGPGEGNLVSGNAGAGIYLQWIAGASIAGNTVGLALDGSTALGNGADGVHLEFGSVATVGPSNVVSANGSAGLASNADDVTVVGNRIGTDAGGQLDRGNAAMGVHIGGGARTQIGGDTPAERNVISGNGTDGVQFSIAGQLDAKVQGNHIGVAADGSTALGNGMRGIATFSPSRVLLGGPNTGEGNVIAHNGWQGIATNATAFDIGIVGNSIHSNSWLGIDLEGNGVTANDALDGDSGGNDRLNFPVLTAVDVVAGTASVDYTLDVPTGPYVVDFFVSAAADPSGYGEGAVHAHRAAVTQSAAGSQAYTATFPAPAGAHITAVAIHHPSAGEYLDSSEFSAAFTAVGCDSDGDGLCDQWEDHNVDGDGDPATDPGPDTDGDGIPNHLDTDDDGDGLPTGTEHADPNLDGHPRDALDTDRDGQPDHLDAPTVPTGAVVAAEQKISALAGGLTAAVDDGDQFGRRVTAIGDLDGDGVVDLAVGANRDDDGGLDAGAVHVLFLDADGTVKAEQKISPTSGGLTATLDPGDSFGTGLAAVGDLDGDGVVDLAVGADSDDDGGSSRGAVHLLFLHRDGTVRAEQKLSHTAGGLGVALADGDWFGHSITALGDLDGDGVVDLAVGAPSTDGAGADRGAVYVLFLNPNGTVRARQQIGHAAGGLGAALDDGDSFGMGVSAIGDLDGDGVAELAVGAHLDDDGGANRGAVYVLFLNPDGTVRAEQKLSATAGGVGTVLDNGDWLGRSVSGIGDLDGDGTADLAVGVPGDDDGGTDRGAVLVWYLHADGTVKLEQKLSATAGGLAAALDDFDAFGNDVAGLGDLDGDGTIGLAVGANRDGDGGTDRGAVYVLDLTAFNHAPVLDGGAALTFTAITEDAFANPGDSVSDLLASAGGDPISDADGDPDGVRWIDHTGGSDNGWFEFSTDGGATWTRYGGWFWDGLLLRPTDRIRFVPAGYRAETASIELQAWDQREGGAGQVVRGVASGGTAPYSAATVTASIAVTAVNDPPTFGLTAAANAGGGADSVAVWDLEGRSERFEAVAEAPDGSIIAAGHTDTAATAGDDDLLLVRFEPDGTLDPGFGRDGHVHVPLGAGDDQAYSVAVQPDGRIVVAGSVSGLGAFVARFLADGTPDVGFGGGDGWVVVDPGVSDRFAGVAVHTDGTIAAVGWSGSDLLAARLLPDGTPDPSFGVGGSVVHVGVQQGQDVALDPTGRMVVATTVLGVVDELAAVRLTTTGALDTTFSGDGIASSPLGMTDSYARGRGVDIQGDGRIVVTGTLQRSGSSAWQDDIALVPLVRFTATGAFDPAFGGGSGYVLTELPGGAYWGGMEAVDIQPDGAIVTVGYADLGYKGQGDTVVVRHLADGDLDPAFGEGGFALTRTGRYWNRLNDVVVTADGDIVAAGELEYDGPFDAAVIRYNPDGSTDPGLVTNALDGAPGSVAGGPAVVMDGDVRVFDNELIDAATWGGTSVNVSRAGGAVASDEFGASGGLGALTEAGPLVLDGLAVGTVTANSGGSLVLDFGGGAGAAEIGRVLESLTFRNPTIPSGPATLLWTFSDGAGGDASGTVTVTVTPLTAVVNSTGDAGDANPGDAVCDTGVLNSEGDPACTLRAAIEELNALGRGAIHFAIPTGDPGRQAGSPGWWTISPTSAALPTITASIELDATTQPGWASAPVIRLDGAARSGSTGDDGLALGGSGITVRGLSVTNWPDEGMQANGTAVTLAGNWFGVAPDGSVAANVSDLVVWGTATGATVGGPNPADGNRFAGAGAGTEAAIYLMADTAGTTVRNNTFGLGPDGVAALGMDNAIALLGDTTGTTITGNRFGHIAGTAILHLDRATATVVAGNTFGLDANGGDAPLGRVLWHDSTGTVRFGGVSPADANTVRHTSQALAAAPTATGALTMLGNSIAGSLWSGFDLGADGVSVNDPGDGDTGPNGLLNVPVLDAVSYAAGAVVVDHTLDIPSGTYRVELFTNPAGGNASGYGEGEVLAHATTVSHGGGALSYRAGFAAGGPVVVTATVTEDLGGGQFGATSEFSAAVAPAVASGATVLDAGGRRSDLVARDGADLSGVPGVAGPAVAFDGSAARLVGPATDVVSGGLTLSGWVRLDAAGDDPRVVAKAASDGAAVYELLVDDATGEAVARLAVTGGVQEVRGGSVLPGAWHMVAATWDGSTVRLYVDGTEVDGAAAGGALGTDVDVPLVVGNVGAGDRGLPGRVDQVQVAHVARSAAWLTTEHANVRDPASFVTMGAAQSAPPAAWSVADGVGRTGRRALAAPSGGGGADAWITAVGIDEPGVEVVSWWKLSDPSGVDVAVGTRTGAVPVDQDELALRYGTLELASNQGPSRTSQASVASTVGAGTWTKVVLRTDEAGTTTAEVGELSTVGPVAQGASPGGSVGFRAGVLLGSSWHIDDVRVRRFVSEEPVVTVHAVERN